MGNLEKQFIPKHFLSELKEPSRRSAREGCDYLISRGIAEPAILEALRSTVSNNLSRFPSLPLLKPRQARALGKRLIADAGLLKESLPELRLFYSLQSRMYPSGLAQGIEVDFFAELMKSAGRLITGLRPVPHRSARGKRNEANGPFSVLHLFLRSTIPPESAVDPKLANPPKMYPWTVELVALARETAGLKATLNTDALRGQHHRLGLGHYLDTAEPTTK